MTALPARRLPGVRFEPQAALGVEALPRMDVAAFVGFASSGPLHCPVAVEDLADFESLFGEAPVLAWDSQRGEPVRAHLAAAVESFFRNGGQRCWVVRVAGASARYTLFPVPGLMRWTPGGQLSQALARARSEGSWADALRVAATLSSEVLTLHTWAAEGTRVELTVTAPGNVAPGDLLRLLDPGTGATVMVPVQEVHLVPEPPPGRGGLLRVVTRRALWLEAGPEVQVLAPPPAQGPQSAEGLLCERLTLGLWVRLPGESTVRLEGLGFCPEHPRYWGALPTDEQRARQQEPGPFELVGAPGTLFPLAGPDPAEQGFFFPIGMETLPTRYVKCQPSSQSTRERDGLEQFGPELFLDDALQGLHSEALIIQANFLREQSIPPRPLRGIYSLLDKEEVTLVALPDAGHRAWNHVETRWLPEPPDLYSDGPLLAIQRALLRLCHARGDLLAILSLPEHYREEQLLQHVSRLRSPLSAELLGVPALSAAEEHSLSHGALYHPWPVSSGEARPLALRSMPPEGAACGVMARRARERGAWTAPANEPWRGVVALTPPLPAERWEEFQEARINLVRQHPQGFLTRSSSTLSSDPELQPISVRRLLALLRRAALRLGATYVFEPNDPAFHRLVQRGFETLLGDLFARGAFAGTARDRAFQVSTHGGRNTLSAQEQGQFFVDLKVAPSTPLLFLNVRLVQSSDRGLSTEER
jgi:hypothetical protein